MRLHLVRFVKKIVKTVLEEYTWCNKITYIYRRVQHSQANRHIFKMQNEKA